MKLREDAVELGQKIAIDRKSSSVLFKVAGWLVVFFTILWCLIGFA